MATKASRPMSWMPKALNSMNNPPYKPTLVVVLGPTAVGKTEVALQLAERLGSPVINCDSRQMFREMTIGTAAPTPDETARARHYFVGTLGVGDYYSAARYEEEALQLISQLSASHSRLVLSGGSMMYVDAVCKGIDDIPTVDNEVRASLKNTFEEQGLEPLLAQLKLLDPEYYDIVDRKNHKRVIHALEICYTAGKPYTSFRTQTRKERPFHVLKIGLERERAELFDRINRRVDQMMADGLLDEVRSLYAHKDSNALNTVGYKELFNVLDGLWPLDMAVERIKKNTRVYAKKQMTWYKHDNSIRWFHPDQLEDIFQYVDTHTQT